MSCREGKEEEEAALQWSQVQEARGDALGTLEFHVPSASPRAGSTGGCAGDVEF